MNATFYPPVRGLRIYLAGAWKRYQCGRRFGHFRTDDWAGNSSCSRCGSPML